MKVRFAAVALAISLPVAAMAEVIKYEGSSTVGKFIGDAAGIYGAAEFKINTASESSGGEKCAARGSCDLGGVAREVNAKFKSKGVDATLIGKDAIAAIVNSSNPVSGLSAEQLKGIFTGRFSNWSEVGGPDLAIKAYIVKKGSATRKVFRQVILGDGAYAGTKVMTPDAKIVTTVAREAGAIGQISFAFLKDVQGVKSLDVGGQQASVENPHYPITRPLYLTTPDKPSGDVAKFIQWSLSDAGQAVVKQRFVGAQ